MSAGLSSPGPPPFLLCRARGRRPPRGATSARSPRPRRLARGASARPDWRSLRAADAGGRAASDTPALDDAVGCPRCRAAAVRRARLVADIGRHRQDSPPSASAPRPDLPGRRRHGGRDRPRPVALRRCRASVGPTGPAARHQIDAALPQHRTQLLRRRLDPSSQRRPDRHATTRPLLPTHPKHQRRFGLDIPAARRVEVDAARRQRHILLAKHRRARSASPARRKAPRHAPSACHASPPPTRPRPAAARSQAHDSSPPLRRPDPSRLAMGAASRTPDAPRPAPSPATRLPRQRHGDTAQARRHRSTQRAATNTVHARAGLARRRPVTAGAPAIMTGKTSLDRRLLRPASSRPPPQASDRSRALRSTDRSAAPPATPLPAMHRCPVYIAAVQPGLPDFLQPAAAPAQRSAPRSTAASARASHRPSPRARAAPPQRRQHQHPPVMRRRVPHQAEATSARSPRQPAQPRAADRRRSSAAALRPHQQLLAARRRARRQQRASSRTTCALVPPTPNELTPARRGTSPRGQSSSRVVITNGLPARSTSAGRALILQQRRDHTVMQCQRRLDQPGHTRGGVQMPDVRSSPSLVRRSRSRSVLCAERLRHRFELDSIAQRRAGAVRLDVADRLRPRHRRWPAPRRSRSRWPPRRRRREANLAAARRCSPPSPGSPHTSCRRQRARRPAACSTTSPTPLPITVPRPARRTLRQWPSGDTMPPSSIDVARALRNAHRQRHPPAAMSDWYVCRLWQAMWTATSEVEQAVCTARLGPRRFSLYDTVVASKSHSCHTCPAAGRRRHRDRRVALRYASRKPRPANTTTGRVRYVPGLLQCLPGTLQEQAMLGIHHLRLARPVAEETRVKPVDTVDRRPRPHIVDWRSCMASTPRASSSASPNSSSERTPASASSHYSSTSSAPGIVPPSQQSQRPPPYAFAAPRSLCHPLAAQAAQRRSPVQAVVTTSCFSCTIHVPTYASALTVGASRGDAAPAGRELSSFLTLAIRSRPINELPPRSKKLSSAPIFSMPSTSLHAPVDTAYKAGHRLRIRSDEFRAFERLRAPHLLPRRAAVAAEAFPRNPTSLDPELSTNTCGRPRVRRASKASIPSSKLMPYALRLRSIGSRIVGEPCKPSCQASHCHSPQLIASVTRYALLPSRESIQKALAAQ